MVTLGLGLFRFMVTHGSLAQQLLKSKYIRFRNNNNTILNGRHILIATGSKPMNLNIPGSENIITSDEFLELRDNNLPDRIVFVGGGYISFEFAHIASTRWSKGYNYTSR